RTLLPLVYEADDENCKEDHHRDEAEEADFGQHDRPRKEERDLEVEQDEEDCNEVIADVELHPRVLERLEAALVRRELLRIGAIRRDCAADREEDGADREAEQDEEQDRKILFQHGHRPLPPLSGPNCGLSLTWCRRGDSNSHGLPHCPLKTACLPISPRRPVS